MSTYDIVGTFYIYRLHNDVVSLDLFPGANKYLLRFFYREIEIWRALAGRPAVSSLLQRFWQSTSNYCTPWRDPGANFPVIFQPPDFTCARIIFALCLVPIRLWNQKEHTQMRWGSICWIPCFCETFSVIGPKWRTNQSQCRNMIVFFIVTYICVRRCGIQLTVRRV